MSIPAPIMPRMMKRTHFCTTENRGFVKYHFYGAFSVHSFLKCVKITMLYIFACITNPHIIRLFEFLSFTELQKHNAKSAKSKNDIKTRKYGTLFLKISTCFPRNYNADTRAAVLCMVAV